MCSGGRKEGTLIGLWKGAAQHPGSRAGRACSAVRLVDHAALVGAARAAASAPPPPARQALRQRQPRPLRPSGLQGRERHGVR